MNILNNKLDNKINNSIQIFNNDKEINTPDELIIDQTLKMIWNGVEIIINIKSINK